MDRKQRIAVRFSVEEMKDVAALKERTNTTTYGKLLRQVILNVARSSDFDFLAKICIQKDDLLKESDRMDFLQMIESIQEMLTNQGFHREDIEYDD